MVQGMDGDQGLTPRLLDLRSPPERTALGRRFVLPTDLVTDVTGRPAAPSPAIPASAGRRLAAALDRRPRIRLGLLLAGPVGWLVIAYLGSLIVLFINAGWSRDAFTGLVKREFTFQNLVDVLTNPLYRAVLFRTVGMAAAVTVTCALLAFPIAYYMARVASPRVRGLLVVAILMPLWSSYLIKAYSWRQILSGEGVLNWASRLSGYTGRAWTKWACGSCSPISGCRT